LKIRKYATENPMAAFLLIACGLFVVAIITAVIVQHNHQSVAADGTTSDTVTTGSTFDYSEGIADNGFWDGVTATDLVQLPNYRGMEIPADVATVTDEEVQSEIETLLSEHEISYVDDEGNPIELTDQLVSDTFSTEYGWTTVAQMKDEIRQSLQNNGIEAYIRDYLRNNVTVSEIPTEVMRYQEGALVAYFQDYAEYFGVSFGEFLETYMGVEDVPTLLAENEEDTLANARYTLAIQAIAEDAGITVTDEDLATWFPEYQTFAEEYGLPYIKQYVLELKVLDYLKTNAVVAEQ